MTARHVAIVGAGITGLAAAYYLEQRGRERGVPVRCTILDAAPQPGGKIRTDSDREFVIEGGPDSFVTDKPWCLDLCHELGLAESLIPCSPHNNKIYLLKKGRMEALPAGFRLSIPTQVRPFVLTPLISPRGKARMALEYLLPARPAGEDESVEQFIGRRFGREAVELFGGPMMAGIYVSDPDRLSMRATFPNFLDMEQKHGSLIRAARFAKKNPPPRRSGPGPAGHAMFNSLRGGMGELVAALRDNISGAWRLSTAVTSIERRDPSFIVQVSGATRETVVADDVILCVPAHQAAGLVDSCHAGLGSGLRQIRFVSTATVSLAYLREDVPVDHSADGYGVLIPGAENRNVIAATWSSNKFKHRAPSDCVLLRLFVGGYRQEALAEQEEAVLQAMVIDEVKTLFGIQAKPLMARVFRWPKGNPQYDVGHLNRVAELERMAGEVRGLHLAGSSYHGIGMPDCIKSALRAVDRIIPAA